ncbi:protein of unknown function DUF610 YibQ [Solidesulfovibrio carbinoliphilus subsp. oakridgensis]|uniref:Divergent polysaccharide deacetylase family protein n=1 Tax=Solidesulfovibrio carbinoliphilus subsp. oakridgensis TaxID=694327 RepID=G7QCX4_9BACT|nr:divergent polysaccharide deacetylase family protein [Solidesulfovibrio carbinoliphilus]EHJ46280.1 protein of unknown function DUF610 YibQ [Solidesulfovibrio carbinoliphilus subsp. oakridgensis]
MKPAKGPGKAPARAKAGEKRHIVLPGKPFYAVVAGLALAASLVVLVLVLFGPFPPLPTDHPSPAAKAGDIRHLAAAASKPRRPAGEHGPARLAESTPRQAELPFEEHLAGRETPPPNPAPASEVRVVMEAAPPAGTAAPGPADTEPDAHPVPGDAGKGPRMVVVIDDIGDHPVMARNLMELPIPVTLAILPNRPRTRSIAAQAAEHGLEIILHQPMQPGSYPRVNPGPGALFPDMDEKRIQATLTDNLSQLPHVVGINNHMGSAFTSDGPGMAAVMPILKAKGLFFMDSVTSATSAAPEAARRAGVPFYRRAVFLDNVRNTRTILGQLKTAERHALKHGRAIAIGHPYGETYEALKIWAKERDPRIALVTLTELGPEF